MWIQTVWNSDMGGDLGPSMFIGSEAETEGAGGSGPPRENHVAICFLEEKLVRTSLEKQFEPPPPPPPDAIVWIRARMPWQEFYFLFFACSRFSYHTF